MYAPTGVKTSPDFPIPDSMKAWVLGDPGQLTLEEQAGAGAEEGRGARAHRRGRDLRHRSRDHLSRPAGLDPRRLCLQQELHARATSIWAPWSRSVPASTNTRSASASPWRSTPAAASASAAARACTPPATTTGSTTATWTRATAPTASPPTAASANTRSTTSTRWSRFPTRCRTRRRRWWSPPAPPCTG